MYIIHDMYIYKYCMYIICIQLYNPLKLIVSASIVHPFLSKKALPTRPPWSSSAQATARSTYSRAGPMQGSLGLDISMELNGLFPMDCRTGFPMDYRTGDQNEPLFQSCFQRLFLNTTVFLCLSSLFSHSLVLLPYLGARKPAFNWLMSNIFRIWACRRCIKGVKSKSGAWQI